ncbi:MAG: hypothetical protein ACR2MU_08245 [Gaiellaceae bacterium]
MARITLVPAAQGVLRPLQPRVGERDRAGARRNIVFAWLLTIPAAALVAAARYWPIQAIF